MSLKSQDLDMGLVLEDCLSMIREQCREAGLTLTVRGLEQPLPLAGEPAKLRQIFLNLLSNAVKFTESGGTIALAAEATPDTICVSVTDTGIGMSPADIEIALQPFGQVDNRLERRYEGTGLGLPLTKSLAELHGASLVIESERGRGTKVTVTFPRLEPLALAEAI
jgi:signal transduction histidine kinase